MRAALVTVWVLTLVVLATALIEVAAPADLLILIAVPLVLLPIVGLMFLRPREELAGWTVFTIWLGSTYLQLGAGELVGFGVVAVCALVGFLREPRILPAVWIAHIAWDFVPRGLPAELADLPTACILFDGLIGVYLIWRCTSGRWTGPAHDAPVSA